MTKSYKAITTDLNSYLTEVKKGVPDVMKGFSDMAKAATSDGTLDKKTKELVALAIAIAVRCDGCIGFHTKTLQKLGATRVEIEEICGMSVYMGGGPSLMYAADALRAFDEFSK
ncbi:MAG: carboxymuconolactone decarboxylase family protein [Aestuariibacter sp.]